MITVTNILSKQFQAWLHNACDESKDHGALAMEFGVMFYSASVSPFNVALLYIEDNIVKGGALWWSQSDETIVGVGPFVYPEARQQGIATKLRHEGFKIMRDNGYKNIIGTLVKGNESGMKSLKNINAKEIGITYMVDLENV